MIYDKAFRNNEYLDFPIEKNYVKSSYHLYPIRLKDKYKKKRKEIFGYLRKNNLLVQVHYIPVYQQPYYRNLGYKTNYCRNAEEFYGKTISLPIFPCLNEKMVYSVINIINSCL
jgi:dTDP-4-amino-4,6-dideoxygalactose transaminase